jgi:hypothetical protein
MRGCRPTTHPRPLTNAHTSQKKPPPQLAIRSPTLSKQRSSQTKHSSPAPLTPRDEGDDDAPCTAAPHPPHLQPPATGDRRSATSSAASTGRVVAWDVPAAPPSREHSASSALGAARSLPRPISSGRLAAAALDGGDGADFVPPHLLATSMVEPQLFGESLSTAKGAAALRLRSSTLRRTGYMDGQLTSAAPVRIAST